MKYIKRKRYMDGALISTDKTFSKISKELNFLSYIKVLNEEDIKKKFFESGYTDVGSFKYDEPPYNPHSLKEEVERAPVEDIKHPLLKVLYREKSEELKNYLEMIINRGNEKFLQHSLIVFGLPYDELYVTAGEILLATEAENRNGHAAGMISAEEFKERAEKELEYYKGQDPGFNGRAEISKEAGEGIKNSNDRLLIGEKFKISRKRVEGLIQHEIGTHMVTHFNAGFQPLEQFKHGFASYDELQEGFALFAEYLIEELTTSRLRTIAARVIAARSLIEDADFKATFTLLKEKHGFSDNTAFSITLRTYRGGGLTKDISYLRGFIKVLRYLNAHRPVKPLLTGKIAIEHSPIIEELMEEGFVKEPALMPRYLEMKESLDKLQRNAGTFTLFKGALSEKPGYLDI